MIKIGNCGWSYLNADNYFPQWEKKFASKLQVYAKLFELVEVNSTFYRIPKLSTAKKWREQADEVNEKFEFTVKVSQLVTHRNPFGKQAFWAFDRMKEIAGELRAKILLFQSPASFKPSKENIDKSKKFFGKIDREGLTLVWEVRWAKDWGEEVVKRLFPELEVNQCVDPFRQNCFYSKDLVYYRLHGFGRPSIYNYDFSERELKELADKVKKEKKPVYVLFNNTACYENGLKFKEMFMNHQSVENLRGTPYLKPLHH